MGALSHPPLPPHPHPPPCLTRMPKRSTQRRQPAGAVGTAVLLPPPQRATATNGEAALEVCHVINAERFPVAKQPPGGGGFRWGWGGGHGKRFICFVLYNIDYTRIKLVGKWGWLPSFFL